jgi:hypothetical protein
VAILETSLAIAGGTLVTVLFFKGEHRLNPF